MSTVTHVGEESTRAKAVTLPDMGGKSSGRAIKDPVSYTHLTLPTNREV